MDGAVLPFHDLTYIPFGASMSTAPIVCTPPAVIRRIYELLHLHTGGDVLLDLGCGHGAILNAIQLRFAQSTSHLSSPPQPPLLHLQCVGVDKNAEALEVAKAGAAELHLPHMHFHLLDFTERGEELRKLIGGWGVTKVFLYLTPSQLQVATVKALLLWLYGEDVQICSYDYPIPYLAHECRDDIFPLFEYHQHR